MICRGTDVFYFGCTNIKRIIKLVIMTPYSLLCHYVIRRSVHRSTEEVYNDSTNLQMDTRKVKEEY